MEITLTNEQAEALLNKLNAERDRRKAEAEKSDLMLKTKLWVLAPRASQYREFHVFAPDAEAAVAKFKRVFPGLPIEDIRGAGSMNLIL